MEVLFENSEKRNIILLREKCPYSELLWSVFSRIQTEYGEIRSISLYSVRMRENTDQNNSEYGRFLRSVCNLELNFESESFMSDSAPTARVLWTNPRLNP